MKHNRGIRINKVLFSSATDQWATPQGFYDELNSEFHFTLDPCADSTNHKCSKYFTKEDDGLIQDWSGNVVFCNPPYGREVGKWVEKCSKRVKETRYNSSDADTGTNRYKMVSRIHIQES